MSEPINPQSVPLKGEQETEASRRLFRLDLWRAPFMGIVMAGWQTFGLLIAIRVFDAPEQMKSLIPMAAAVGLLLTPLSSSIFAALRLRPSHAAAAASVGASVFMGLAAMAPGLVTFVTFGFLGQVFLAQISVMVIDIYAANYPARVRARRVSPHIIAMMLVSAGIALVGGFLLDNNLRSWRWIYAVVAFAGLAMAMLFLRMPSDRPSKPKVFNPFSNIYLAFSDRLFGLTLLAWMLMGLGNLLTLPLRMEILANRDYGFNISNLGVGLIFTAIPALLQISSTPLWAKLFDQMHFMVYRIWVNLMLLLSMLIFFSAPSVPWLILSAAFQGLGMGGGALAWNLWVTKLAPVGKAGAYMSVHTSTTGMRALVAPALGYFLLTQTGRDGVMWTSGLLIVGSMLIFIGLLRHPRFNAS